MKHPRPEKLWHYTCSHTVPHILSSSVLLPGLMLPRAEDRYAALSPFDQRLADGIASLVWLTDLAPPLDAAAAAAVGLDPGVLACDRTEACFEVVPNWAAVSWWPAVRRRYPGLHCLEKHPGALPAHWYVSSRSVPYERRAA